MSHVRRPPARPEPPARTSSAEPNAWRRLALAGRPRLTKANLLGGLLALSLGFAIATQIHQTQIQGLENLREDELVRVLDDVQSENARLGEEISALQTSRDRLVSGQAGTAEARAAAQARLNALSILAGTAPAIGPGITLTIADPNDGVTAPLLLDAVQELRDAGAEVIAVNNVRVIANTSFTDLDAGTIDVSGKQIRAPYRIDAIGDPQTMASALDIPGGIAQTVRDVEASSNVTQSDALRIDALQPVTTPQYARPVASPTDTSP